MDWCFGEPLSFGLPLMKNTVKDVKTEEGWALLSSYDIIDR